MLNTAVLVLNRNYQPVHVTNVKRAFSLLYMGVARAIDSQYKLYDFESWAALSAAEHEHVSTIDKAIRVPRVLVLMAYEYLPKGTSVDVIGYWFPTDHRGPVNNDLIVNLKSGSNPVLSHLFINYLLDTNNAIENYSYYGYMSPLNGVTPQRLISEKLLPPQLSSTVVLPSYFRQGLYELQLPPAANAQWESTWNTFSKGL